MSRVEDENYIVQQEALLDERLNEMKLEILPKYPNLLAHVTKIEATSKENLKQLEGHSQALQDTILKLRKRKEDNFKDEENRNDEKQKACENLEKGKLEIEMLLRKAEELRDCIDESTKENQKESQFLTTQDQVTDKIAKELEKALDYFRENLKLRIKKISGDRLQFLFTHIDSSNPAAVAYFCVRITDKRSYEVTDCDPPIPDLEDLQRKLNDTNNFQAFVITAERRFRELTL